ncbi:[FeFe] hydrogenase H-cluster radical SAM maturase HydE [Flavobacterium franklandianum]|uniref:[FeFe] hydrogenase H-cluster radical SAM maturase HydE n=1 Tax=Flavobacterium franklandianum TaxID=2594430 RepID=A0A553CMH9_9FLAO|nr:[FeFe] hydrogenase H-cluster radical SAM maturase HydE [Flavobacterium franklandianum]
MVNQTSFYKKDLITMLNADEEDQIILFKKSKEITDSLIGNKVHLRGLIEYSNVCIKDCLYCGIQKSNKNTQRYTLSDEEVIQCALYALEHNYGSIAIQSGERTDPLFISKITHLLKGIKKLSNGKLGITLSLGEQTLETYKEWFDAGAHRYLLRIETSNRALYSKIHPNNDLHNFDKRLEALQNIRKAGFQLGTGVMIGLPHQTIGNLADDLLFLKALDVDMVGMGPYIEHFETPLFEARHLLKTPQERLDLTFKMIASLRIIMKDINIVAATALQAIDKIGREKAIRYGANILMPNITPGNFRNNYKLYQDKPCTDENANDCNTCIDARMSMIGSKIGYNEWGDSKHFTNLKV